jgi:hypothetical protein
MLGTSSGRSISPERPTSKDYIPLKAEESDAK